MNTLHTEERALELRVKLMKAHNLTPQEVSRHYDVIADHMGIDIVWGKGGAQTKRAAELTAAGTPFIKVQPPVAAKRAKLELVEGWWL